MSFNPCNCCGVLVEDDDAFEASGGYCAECDAAPRHIPAPRHELALTHIPTGHGEHVLCLQVHRQTVWAGLYPTRDAGAPLEIGVAARRTGARRCGRDLVIGGQAFPFHSTQMRRAIVWLDHHGVHTRETVA